VLATTNLPHMVTILPYWPPATLLRSAGDPPERPVPTVNIRENRKK
jgi:hypothetical protein